MKLTIREIAVFGMSGALMFISKKLMEGLPNIHLLGLFIVSLTVVYRAKALYPIYTYVLLDGLFGGFNLWWIPYLYIWTVLWGAAMLLPKKMPFWLSMVVYPTVAGLHGIAFGVLYAPVQAAAMGLDLKQTLAWIAAGFPFDIIHGIGNFCVGLLIAPTVILIRKIEKTN